MVIILQVWLCAENSNFGTDIATFAVAVWIGVASHSVVRKILFLIHVDQINKPRQPQFKQKNVNWQPCDIVTLMFVECGYYDNSETAQRLRLKGLTYHDFWCHSHFSRNSISCLQFELCIQWHLIYEVIGKTSWRMIRDRHQQSISNFPVFLFSLRSSLLGAFRLTSNPSFNWWDNSVSGIKWKDKKIPGDHFVASLLTFSCWIHSIIYVINRGFHKLDEIGNDGNIGIRGITMWKQKNPVKKCYPQWG